MNIFEKAVELHFLYQDKRKIEQTIADATKDVKTYTPSVLRKLYDFQQAYSHQPNKQWKRYEAVLMLLMYIQPSVFGGERLKRGSRKKCAEIMRIDGSMITRDVSAALFAYSNFWQFRVNTENINNVLDNLIATF